jgi:hypothetical protein
VLTHRFALVASPIPPEVHAAWLVEAVEELVGLLATPTQLATEARRLGATWPDPLSAPTFRVEGQAWLAAVDVCLGDGSDQTAEAWKEAWFLLSDVLATEALSPFVDRPRSTSTDAST